MLFKDVPDGMRFYSPALGITALKKDDGWECNCGCGAIWKMNLLDEVFPEEGPLETGEEA